MILPDREYDFIRKKDVSTVYERIGLARIFQRGGGVTLCQSEATHQIVMTIKKRFQKKGLLTMAKIWSWPCCRLLA